MSQDNSRKIVLLVEDDLLVRKFASAVLQRAGYTVIPATDATDALRVAATDIEIDAIVTDVNIGDGLNGIELAKRIAQEKPGIAVLVMSGAPNTEILAAKEGFPFLAKPFTSGGFVQRIRALLAISRESETQNFQVAENASVTRC